VEEQTEEPESAAKQHKAEMLKVVENFALGMIRTFGVFGSVNLEKIHTSLSHAMGENYELSMKELNELLSRMAKEDKIEQTGNSFAIKKK
jgi:hypothetical protein